MKDFSYTSTSETFLADKIVTVINHFGVLSIKQLYKYFAMYGKGAIDYLITGLYSSNYINYSSATELATARFDVGRSSTAQEIMSFAFWVLASVGEENVDVFSLCDAPVQFMWIERGTCNMYDVTVLYPTVAKEVCQMWARTRPLTIPTDEEDLCTHIALVYNEEDAKMALKYGFTHACILDPNTYEPIFTPPLAFPPRVLPKEEDEFDED